MKQLNRPVKHMQLFEKAPKVVMARHEQQFKM